MGAQVSMRMQAEANEAARLKTEVEALQYKVVGPVEEERFGVGKGN